MSPSSHVILVILKNLRGALCLNHLDQLLSNKQMNFPSQKVLLFLSICNTAIRGEFLYSGRNLTSSHWFFCSHQLKMLCLLPKGYCPVTPIRGGCNSSFVKDKRVGQCFQITKKKDRFVDMNKPYRPIHRVCGDRG